MNSKERVKRTFHFEKPDRVPISYFGLKSDFFPLPTFLPKDWQPTKLAPHVAGGHNTMSSLLYRVLIYRWNKKCRIEASYPKNWWENPHKSIDDWGVIWQSSGTQSADKTMGHPVKGPLSDSWDNLEEYQPPNASEDKRYRLIKSSLWKFLGRNKYILGTMGPNFFFTQASRIRGFNNLLVDFARNGNKVKKLIDIIKPFYIVQVKKFKEHYPKLDSIMICDDMGTQKSPFVSPKIFREFFRIPFKEIIDLTHDLGLDFILHCCGQVLELIPEFIEVGIDVLEFDSPRMTGIENFKRYAEERKIAFWCCSDIQTIYSQGTPQEVEEFTKYMIRELGNNEGGFAVYEYTDNKCIGTPKRNIIAMREATKKWGKYNKDGVIEWLA